jgi:hypothetical protein
MEKEITGKISKITKPASKTFTKHDGTFFTIWSIGLNVNSEWYNIKSDSSEGTKQFLFSSKLNREFQPGDDVRIFLQPEDKQGKYWKIKAIVPYSPTDDVPVEEIEEAPKKEGGTLTQEGVLTTVAKTGGIKIDGGDWINPSAVVKQKIEVDPSVLEDLKTKRGSRVEVKFNPSKTDTYEAVKVLEEQPQKQLNPKSKQTSDYKPSDSSYKAMAVSYSKDLVIADKIKIDEMLDTAEKIFSYIRG